MEAVFGIFDEIILCITTTGIFLLEFAGSCMIIWGGVQAVIGLVKHKKRVRLTLAKNMSLALEFKLGSEILRTVVVRDWSEIALVGAIILLRGLLTLLIHFEISSEESRQLHIEPGEKPVRASEGSDD